MQTFVSEMQKQKLCHNCLLPLLPAAPPLRGLWPAVAKMWKHNGHIVDNDVSHNGNIMQHNVENSGNKDGTMLIRSQGQIYLWKWSSYEGDIRCAHDQNQHDFYFWIGILNVRWST